MIFTKPKPMKEILDSLAPYEKPLILGCGTCSADCHPGGEKEVADMKKRLKSEGMGVVEGVVIESLCNLEKVRRALKDKKEKVKKADVVLVMSCGIAVQVVAAHTDKPVVPGLDTVFAGVLERIGHYREMCSICGQCVVGEYGGICPVSRCPKELLNGPCGGTIDGKCEVDSEIECAWVEIYERMKSLGNEGSLARIAKPKDHLQSTHPRRVNTGKGILKGEW